MNFEININSIFLVFVYSSLSLLIILFYWSVRRANPVFWFVVFQWIIVFGSFLVVDYYEKSDLYYIFLFFIALISFFIGSILAFNGKRINNLYFNFFNSEIEKDKSQTLKFIFIIFLFSTIVCLIYYQKIGYNLFSELFGNSISDFTSARLSTYSGEKYFAPGYVNQFKNVLYPTTLIALIFTYRRINFFILLVFILFAIISSLYFLLGTGQRAPFVYSFMCIIFGLYLSFNIQNKLTILFFLLIIFLFGLLSFLNGRIEELNLNSIIVSFIKRIFINDQQEGLLNFRYIFTLPQNNFLNWRDSLLGILPSHPGSTLPHENFFRLHGTLRGTSSLTSVGSAYYNGGIITVILLFFFMGFFYAKSYIRLLSGKRTLVRCLSYGGLFFIMSVYVAGPPTTFLNKGVLAYLLLLFIRKIKIQ